MQAFSRIRSSAFVRSLLLVMSGTAIAQAIGFALSPLIGRLYSPADFGVFGAFTSVASVVGAGATLDYSQAMMLPKDRRDALNLFVVSCLSSLLVSVACGIACCLLPATLRGLLKTDAGWVLPLLVASTLAAGLSSSFQAWAVRNKAFDSTSASQVVRSASSNVVQIALGFLTAGSLGLIVSDVLADLLATLNLSRVLRRDRRLLREWIDRRKLRQLAHEYHDFPLYSATQNVVNALSSGLPVLLLAHSYGLAVAGAFAFASRILQVPMGFVTRALRQVLFQKSAELLHEGRHLAPLYIRVTVGLFLLALVPSAVVALFAKPLFVWVFGAKWATAGEFASSLVVWLLFVFCNLPATLFARLIRAQRAVFLFDLGVLAARTGALVAGGAYLTAGKTVLLFSALGAVTNAALILLVWRAVVTKEAGPASAAIHGPASGTAAQHGPWE
jgi:O-antigen/teichoic acid export membrane protein